MDEEARKARAREQARLWREEHKEEYRAYQRKYWAENKKELTKKRNEKREHTRKVQRAWREKNREKYNAHHREWYRRNKAKKMPDDYYNYLDYCENIGNSELKVPTFEEWKKDIDNNKSI